MSQFQTVIHLRGRWEGNVFASYLKLPKEVNWRDGSSQGKMFHSWNTMTKKLCYMLCCNYFLEKTERSYWLR